MRSDKLNPVLELVLNHRLGKAIEQLENLLLTFPNQPDMERLGSIKYDYQLMAGYWKNGGTDPQRSQIYEHLLRQLYMLLTDMMIRDRMDANYVMSNANNRALMMRNDWSVPAIRLMLESYVSNAALLELEPEPVREKKAAQLYRDHQQQMNSLFDYLWTSYAWNDAVARGFEDMLLSPTIDVHDQQLMVSAITLSLLNAFDMGKFRVLANVYAKTPHELLRQRALVGWVLGADGDKSLLYNEINDTVRELCADKRCQQELTELQMQMVFCMLADNDSQKIKNEIMPDLMKGNNMKVTRQGIVEMEEDKLEEILHPEAAEQNMERMEASMKKMADMQRRGSDIYFAGFSQMKRFPFFNDVSNWFVPFTPTHPGISMIWNNAKGHRFLQIITKVGAFCDSDKYSFVLAFEQVVSHLPAQMMQMIENGEASPMAIGGEVPVEEQLQPAFLRRMYLQNLYRFYRLFPQRSAFRNPFEPEMAVFFANPLFQNTGVEDCMSEVASFLIKQGMVAEAERVLANVSVEHRGLQYYLMMGHLRLSHQLTTEWSASDYYRKALELQPDSEPALKGYARSLFADQCYDEALLTFRRLLEAKPDNRSIELNIAVCEVNLGHYEEALKLLYKLNYNFPDDNQINRVLAWAQTLSGKYEQAAKIYDRLLSSDQRQPSDFQNYAYCLWFQHDIVSAISLFRQFLSEQSDEHFSLQHELMVAEHDMLVAHGIPDVEIQLMLDVLGA